MDGVATTARLLYTIYPRAAADLAKARGHLSDLRGDVLFIERYPKDWEQAMAAHEREERAALAQCEECAARLNGLAGALPGLLPKLWPGLRLVAIRNGHGESWHDTPEFDWDGAVGELRQIESACVVSGEADGTLAMDQEPKDPKQVRNAALETGEEKALAALVLHPEWSDTKIAKHIGCQRTSLYRWPKFKAAKEALKSGREERPHIDDL